MGILNKDNKAVFQEFRYIKIPDRRLISGLLYINVVNHDENDAQNDFNQAVHEKHARGINALANEIKYSDTFTGTTSPPDFNSTQDRGRDQMKHSFADYDCFVFHVAGGMTLSGGINTPEGSGWTQYNGAAALATAGYVSGDGTGGNPYVWGENSAQLTDAELTSKWWKHSDGTSNPLGDYCSHFVKYHLISRINNASGHGLDKQSNNQRLYAKHRPIQQQTYINPDGPINRLSQANIEQKYVLSHGIYDTEDSLGQDLGAASYATLAEGKSSGTNAGFTKIETNPSGNPASTGETQSTGGVISDHDGNTYFSPVDTIKIYGTHRLVWDKHQLLGQRIYSHQGARSAHATDFWDLVIDIGLRGNNPGGSGGYSNPNKSLVKPQINIMFQPFGETAEFDVSETAHTS